jgi:hypothetical protein
LTEIHSRMVVVFLQHFVPSESCKHVRAV